MNTNHPDTWESLRSAYRPQTPELDTDAIMAAVRREAAAHPLRRSAPSPVAAIPTWACAAAASLALLAAAGAFARSFGDADDHIAQAWLQSIDPGDVPTGFLDDSMNSYL